MGRVIFYVNENILCRVLDIDYNFNDLEIRFLEFSLRNRYWLCAGLYKTPNQNKKYFLNYNNKSLTKFSSQFGMFFGDFNLTTENWNLDTFISCFDLKIHVLTLFQQTGRTSLKTQIF